VKAWRQAQHAWGLLAAHWVAPVVNVSARQPDIRSKPGQSSVVLVRISSTGAGGYGKIPAPTSERHFAESGLVGVLGNWERFCAASWTAQPTECRSDVGELSATAQNLYLEDTTCRIEVTGHQHKFNERGVT